MSDYNIVSVSGGKDSTATLLLAIERGVENLRAVTADTGHEHQQTYEYLDYLERKTGVVIERIKADFSEQIAHKRDRVQTVWRNEGVSEQFIESALSVLHPVGVPFLDLAIWKGRFPSRRAQFCTEQLKIIPIREQVIQPLMSSCEVGDIYSWQGVRAEESEKRARLSELEEISDGLWNYRPIHKWNAQQVFDFHRTHGVKPNPLYKEGMSRVGCMPCINCNKTEIGEIARRFPEYMDQMREWESIVAKASRLGCSTFFSAGTAPDTPRGTSIDTAIEWAKTTRGGRQYDLIATSEDVPQCSSSYGLCG